MNEWQTEDFIFPKVAGTRGTKIETLPRGERFECSMYNIEYEAAFEEYEEELNILESAYREQIGRDLARAVDEEMMRVLSGYFTVNEIREQLSNPATTDTRYEDYDRAMRIIKA